MSATITNINARYASNGERLLAASSRIIQLEHIVEAGAAIIDIKQSQLETLQSILEGLLGLLDVSRPLFPVDLLQELDPLIEKSRECLSLVESVKS